MPFLHVDIDQSQTSGQPPGELILLEFYIDSPLFGPCPLAFTKPFRQSKSLDGNLLSNHPVTYIHLFDKANSSFCFAVSSNFQNEALPPIRAIINSYATRTITGLLNVYDYCHSNTCIQNTIDQRCSLNTDASSLMLHSESIPALIISPGRIEQYDSEIHYSSLLPIPTLVSSPSYLHMLLHRMRDFYDETMLNPELLSANSAMQIMMDKKSIPEKLLEYLSHFACELHIDVVQYSDKAKPSSLSLKLVKYFKSDLVSQSLLVQESCRIGHTCFDT